MSDSSILVVGATGQLGTRLVRQLAAAGVKPRALVRSRQKGETLGSMARPVIGDLLAPDSLVEGFRGAERVFIVAPPTPEMEVLERNAIDAAVACGARHIVYLSNFAAREGSGLRPMHIHGLHERVVASRGIGWTVLGPTRYMTNFPFNWPSVLNDGVLLEAGGAGIMTCIDPDDVAEIAVRALTEEGHKGQTYRLTSEDAFTAIDLAAVLSKHLGRDVRVSAPNNAPAPMAAYFALVAAGAYKTTDTAAKVLGRAPHAYADWLERHRSHFVGGR
jgi:uncharacterized protein YbjT (DUF2867 family)